MIFREEDLVKKYSCCNMEKGEKLNYSEKFKLDILEKIREHNPNSNSIKYERNSYIINDDKVEVDIDFYLNNIENYDVKKFNGEDVGFFIEKFDFDSIGRPKGASVIVLKYEKSRRQLNKPLNWDEVTRVDKKKRASKVFHKGHILPGALVDYIYKQTPDTEKTKKSIFIQTKWSNENFKGQNIYNQFNLVEEPVINHLKSEGCQITVFMKAKLIYSSEKAIIPMGNHIQAKTQCSCGKCKPVSLNRFLPNITPDYIIDYETGKLI